MCRVIYDTVRHDSWRGLDLQDYARALALIEEAVILMESAGDTLIAAHLTTPLGLVQDRLNMRKGPMRPARP